MPFYRAVGALPRKRHVVFRRPDGGIYAEELMGEEGFSADSSLLYHRFLPTAIVASESATDPLGEAQTEATSNLPLAPRHFRTTELKGGGDLVAGRRLLAGNNDVLLSLAVADRPSELYRNSVGDETVYLQSGTARFESTYGTIEAREGDYVTVPTGTIHRWVPHGSVTALVIQASGHIRPPRRYLSQYGQFLEHAPYCERDLRGPTDPLVVDGSEAETPTPVLVRTRGGLTRMTFAHHPFDVVGWDGYLYPYAFNIADFEPVVKKTHAPPPVHQTFEGPNFVICSFCPRPLDFHADAVPIPYNHHNVDSDEFMYYVAGDYAARKGSGIDIGSVSLHPAGFTHGPQPGAVEAALGAERTTETAVMIDTFRPLDIGPAGRECEDAGYAWTWA